MATTPGTSLASTACFNTLSIRVRAFMTLSWALARPGTDATAATAAAPCSSSRRLCVMARSSWLRRLDSHDLVEASPSDVERRVRDELDDLGLGEVAAQLRPQRVVDLAMVDGQLLGEAQRRALARRDQLGGLVLDRGDLGFGRSRNAGPGIAHGHSVSAPIDAGDLEPDELAKDGVDLALARERRAERR